MKARNLFSPYAIPCDDVPRSRFPLSTNAAVTSSIHTAAAAAAASCRRLSVSSIRPIELEAQPVQVDNDDGGRQRPGEEQAIVSVRVDGGEEGVGGWGRGGEELGEDDGVAVGCKEEERGFGLCDTARIRG